MDCSHGIRNWREAAGRLLVLREGVVFHDVPVEEDELGRTLVDFLDMLGKDGIIVPVGQAGEEEVPGVPRLEIVDGDGPVERGEGVTAPVPGAQGEVMRTVG